MDMYEEVFVYRCVHKHVTDSYFDKVIIMEGILLSVLLSFPQMPVETITIFTLY